MSVTAINQPLLLGQAIKSARKTAGMTQVGLAHAVGTYPRAIIELERGRSSADIRLILTVLAQVGLQMSVATL